MSEFDYRSDPPDPVHRDDDDSDYLPMPDWNPPPRRSVFGTLVNVTFATFLILVLIALVLPVIRPRHDVFATPASAHAQWQARQAEIDLALEQSVIDVDNPGVAPGDHE